MVDNTLKYRDELYEQYATNIKSENVLFNEVCLQSRKPFLLKLIKNYFPKNLGAKIIDLGCGDGALLFFAKKVGYRDLTGFDISLEQIKRAKSLNIHSVFLNDAIQAISTLQDNSIDVIITFDVIEHLTKNESLFFSKQVYRVLNPQGRWIIHTLNAESPFFGRIRYGDFTHENGFTSHSIKQLLTLSGFKKINCYEDVPIPHGIKSFIRYCAWKLIRNIYRFLLAVETGEKNGIFSQNFLSVSEKNSPPQSF